MANFIQRGIQTVITWAMGTALDQDPFEAEHAARQKATTDLLAYYNGLQRKPMKIGTLGKDYNVITNHLRTIIDRSVSMLMGAGVTFDLPGDEQTTQGEIIAQVWDANRKDTLLHDMAQFGSIYGTPAIKIIPDGRVSMIGDKTHRLVALNPFNLSIFTAPDDIENVTAYVYRWTVGDVAWREVTEKQENGLWMIRIEKADQESRGRWSLVDEQSWQYEFPPIVHGKNLPNAGNVYGYSDIEGIIALQDRYNESQSNINKILSLQAWAQKWVTGGKWPRVKDDKGTEYLDIGPDKALEFSTDATVGILQPSGDLASSRQFANDIRRDMFDIAATVDADTVKDKIGALTNFGLRVLFKNELAKNATKQLLYGELLLQVNNRLLQLAGYKGEQADPGKVVFGDALPANDTESIDVLIKEKDLGVVSLQSAAKARGYDWEEEQKRMADEKQATANVGGNMIRDFLAGRNA